MDGFSVEQLPTYQGHSFVGPGGLGGVFKSLLGRISKKSSTTQKKRSSEMTNDKTRDCVLLIDASGSMKRGKDWRPSRLEGAKNAARTFCRRLEVEEPNARIAIVAYADNAKVLAQLTPVGKAKVFHRAIDRIDEFGWTNMRAALKKAGKILKGSKSSCQVVLLSDGHSTESDPRKAAETLKKSAIIECVGIGGSPSDVDEDLLKWIASEYPDGSKRYRWIGDPEKLSQVFYELAGRITKAAR